MRDDRKSFAAIKACTFLAFLISFFSFRPSAQSIIYVPAQQNESWLKTLAEKYETKYKETLAGLPKDGKPDYEKVYKIRWENIKQKFDKKEVFTEPEAQKYIDGLLKEIVSNNANLGAHELRAYFSRSGVPNASYIGEGIILFNMGLFYRLENEDQAAFVLCHEIAHSFLRHSENSIDNYVKTLNSKEFQEELKRIKNMEFGKRELLENLLKGFSFNSMRHSRNHESQADSFAVELMRNTRFDCRQAASALAILDSIDKDVIKTEEILPRYFNHADYPFQKKWLAKEEGLLGGHAQLKEDKELADSLKTHPDCKQRIKVLQPLITQYSTASKMPSASQPFLSLKNSFIYELTEYAFASDQYTRSLYYTLQFLDKKPADLYFVTQVGRIFNGLYAAQKAHTMGKLVDQPAPYYSPAYNQLLQFIQNLYSENYASLSYHFLKQYATAATTCEPLKKAYQASIQIAEK